MKPLPIGKTFLDPKILHTFFFTCLERASFISVSAFYLEPTSEWKMDLSLLKQKQLSVPTLGHFSCRWINSDECILVFLLQRKTTHGQDQDLLSRSSSEVPPHSLLRVTECKAIVLSECVHLGKTIPTFPIIKMIFQIDESSNQKW